MWNNKFDIIQVVIFFFIVGSAVVRMLYHAFVKSVPKSAGPGPRGRPPSETPGREIRDLLAELRGDGKREETADAQKLREGLEHEGGKHERALRHTAARKELRRTDLEEAMPRDSLPQGGMSRDSLPQGGMSRDSRPQEGMSWDSLPQEGMSRDSMSGGSQARESPAPVTGRGLVGETSTSMEGEPRRAHLEVRPGRADREAARASARRRDRERGASPLAASTPGRKGGTVQSTPESVHDYMERLAGEEAALKNLRDVAAQKRGMPQSLPLGEGTRGRRAPGFIPGVGLRLRDALLAQVILGPPRAFDRPLRPPSERGALPPRAGAHPK